MASFRRLATITEEESEDDGEITSLQEQVFSDGDEYKDKYITWFGETISPKSKQLLQAQHLRDSEEKTTIPIQNGTLEITDNKKLNVKTQSNYKTIVPSNGFALVSNKSTSVNEAGRHNQVFNIRERSDINTEQTFEHNRERNKNQKQLLNIPTREHLRPRSYSQEINSFLNSRHAQERSTLVSSSRLVFNTVPRRGTVAFMKYASERVDRFPSYWRINNPESCPQNCTNDGVIDIRIFLKDVDRETWNTISKLVTRTLDLNLVGLGSDATGINYHRFRVMDIKRVENPKLFEIYRNKRLRLLKKMIRSRHICPDIGRIPGSKGKVTTSKLLSKTMKSDLYYEVNEHYLFHGTKPDSVASIIENGLDPSYTNDSAMLGKGVYAAEKATKSDQYTDSKAQRTPNGTNLTLILTRMLLGNVFLCNDIHESLRDKNCNKLSGPPCKNCLDDDCSCGHRNYFDSVMGDGEWLFREFVVYERDQCYPEYVITYQRI